MVTNDDFNYHNANEDMIFSYVYNRMQNGKLNDLKQELNAFKDLTVEELKNNYGIEISVDNKSKVDELTSKNAVKDFIESRMEKIAAIENTYNAVTKLFPNANPEIKELLMYSAQGMENTKERRKTLGVEVSDSISQPILRELITRAVPNEEVLSTFFNSTPQNFGDTYAGLTLEEQENFKTFLRNNTKVNELVKDDVIKKLDDLSKLTNREKDFVAAYNALKNPQLQNEFLQQSQTLWEKYNNIANQKQQQDFEQETQTTTPQGDEQLPPDLTGGVQGVQPAVVDPANPLAQWYSANNMDYTTPEDAIMASLQDDVQSNRLTPEQAQAVLADWQANQTKQVVPQQPSQVQTQPQPTPDQILKDPKKPQSFLMTKTKDRDSALQSDKKVIGDFRGVKEDGTPKYGIPVNGQPVVLATFAEVQNKLKTLFDSNENLNDHINFLVTDTGYVLVLIDDMPVSIVDKGLQFKGTPEQEKAFLKYVIYFIIKVLKLELLKN